MAPQGSVYSSTLQTITTTKLEELAKKRNKFEQARQSLLDSAKGEQDSLKRLAILVDGVKTCFEAKLVHNENDKSPGRLNRVSNINSSIPNLQHDLMNIDRFLEQARFDPSLSTKVSGEWVERLVHYLDVQRLRFTYADLYGKLVTEWLSSESPNKKGKEPDISMKDSFEEIPGAKKLESRRLWEKTVFEPAVVDVDVLDRYLSELFNVRLTEGKELTAALNGIRMEVRSLQHRLGQPLQFGQASLRWVINGLVASDLLSNEKRSVLRDFSRNESILNEIADVLNMRLASLSTWTWGDVVPVEQRRQLNGAYNIHMHEDLLQAIFLHYIGVQWAVLFKKATKRFYHDSTAWVSNEKVIAKVDKLRRGYYLGAEEKTRNLQTARKALHSKNYFMFQLLENEHLQHETIEGEEEAEIEGRFLRDAESDEAEEDDDMGFGLFDDEVSSRPAAKRQRMMAVQQHPGVAPCRQFASKAARRSAPSSVPVQRPTGEDNDFANQHATTNPIQAKQKLLHILSAEIAINTNLHGELTCFRSAFEQWNPTLPHATISRMLTFFGVSEEWKAFFERFLQAPLKFTDDDDSTAPQTRRRGTPGSHALSDFFGEMMLFCLDFSINKSTQGSLLYRLNEDFWFWSASQDKTVVAWEKVVEFANVTGTTLDTSKTGTVRIVQGGEEASALDSRLPKGKIRWGFLVLDPNTGRFQIDQQAVERHVRTLQTQLQNKTKSIFDWISAYNAYAATFFSSNFGKAANCFGRAHVDEMLATHRLVQDRVFQGANAVDFLKKEIHERFGIDNVPDGFLFFPVELGGLDLKSPFVNLMQVRDSVERDPQNLLKKFREAEKDAYRNAKKAFERGHIQHERYALENPDWKPDHHADEFMSFEEFVKYREDISFFDDEDGSLVSVYERLLEKPEEDEIIATAEITQALAHLGPLSGQASQGGIKHRWNLMESYWKWIAQLYGPEVIDNFAGLSIVDAQQLPIGMISLFREQRIKWQD